MLTLRPLRPGDALAGAPGGACDRDLVAFAAEDGGEVQGVALAESHPNLVHVLRLEGSAGACLLLLRRLLALAGERDVSGWFPADLPGVLGLLGRAGFARGQLSWRGARPLAFCERRQGRG
jgi:hypothetical protein